jgi:uncharacterized membrane protein
MWRSRPASRERRQDRALASALIVLGLRRKGLGGLLGHLGGELRQALAVFEHTLSIAPNQCTLEADKVRDRPAAQKIGQPLQVFQQAVTSVNECKFGCGLRWPLVSSPVG